MEKIITVVLQRSGSHHMTSEKVTPEDARRWADEGFNVFQLAARGNSWALHHVNSGKVFTDQMQLTPSDEERAADVRTRLLIGKVGP